MADPVAGPVRTSLIRLVSAVVLLAGFSGAAAHAQNFRGNAQPRLDLPTAEALQQGKVLFTAEKVIYDDERQFVRAEGNVQIIQTGRSIYADRLVLNRATEEFHAIGNVLLIDRNGNRLSTSEVRLNRDFTRGFLRNAQIFLKPDVRFAADYAERRNEQDMAIYRGVFSPCPLCEDNPDRAPVWQIKASQIEVDGTRQQVFYRNARFELFGLPVFYLPFFAHADPRADRMTGFLPPEITLDDSLGFGFGLPYFFDFGESLNVTVSPQLFFGAADANGQNRDSLGGALIEGQIESHNGPLRVNVDGIYAWQRAGTNFDAAVGSADAGQHEGAARIRADLDISGQFRAKADYTLFSDADVMNDTGFRGDSIFTNFAEIEGFHRRSWSDVKVSDRVTARAGLASVEDLQPTVGQAEFDYISEPFGGAVTARVNLSGHSIHRERGRDTDRAALKAWVDAPFTFGGGQRVTFKAGGTAAAWRYDEFNPANATDVSGSAAGAVSGSEWRARPAVSVDWQLPLARRGERWGQVIEPLATAAWNGEFDNRATVPNDDSIDIELDEASLFDLWRTPGLDLYEGGGRVAYGARYSLYDVERQALRAFVGQSYQFDDGNGALPADSGIREGTSSIVAGIEVAPADWLDARWAVRLDADGYGVQESRGQATIKFGGTSLTGTYKMLDPIIAARQETASLSLRTDIADAVFLRASVSDNLRLDEFRDYGIGATWDHWCFNLGADTKIKQRPGTDLEYSFSFTVGLKYLGSLSQGLPGN